MKRLIFIFCFYSFSTYSQIDSAVAVPLVGVNIGGQLPMADLANRFGANLRAGGSLLYKTKSNWLLGTEASYFFGRNVRQDVLAQLKNSDGFLLDNEGYPADVRVTERGILLYGQIGRLIVNKSDGPNSGLMVCLGLGYMQHKVNLYDAQQKVAAIRGDLEKGYDHLTAGASGSVLLGYLHLGENQLLNYFLGLDLQIGQTKSLRGISYDTGLPDTKQRLDILAGLRFGWILPLYPRKPNNEYYN